MKGKIFQTFESGPGAKGVKTEKYEALNKAVRKGLLILRSENVPVDGLILKEEALES